MTANRRATTFLLLMTLVGASVCQAETAGPKSTKTVDIGKLFVKHGGISPVSLLLRAHILGQEGKDKDSLAAYRQVLQQWPAETRWGRLACLRIARSLLCQRPPRSCPGT